MTELERLRSENECLQEEVRQLKATFVGPKLSYPAEWRLTKLQKRYLRVLSAHEAVSHDQIMAAIYSDGRERTQSNIGTHIYSMRKKLRPFGVRIMTDHGTGYHLTPESRKIIRR